MAPETGTPAMLPHRDEQQRTWTVPTGKVKWFNEQKGFGFLADDDGGEVFLHVSALPEGMQAVAPGTRMEFGVAQGRRGAQALQATVLGKTPSVDRSTRMPAEQMAGVNQDLITLLDGISEGLQHGRYPDRSHGQRIAKILRIVADNLDA